MHLNIYLLTSLVLWLSTGALEAQDVRFMESGAAGFALGGTQAVTTDVSSITGNQAGLANVSSLSLSFSAERRFHSSALNFYALSFAVPTTFGNFGMALQRFGNGDLNQQIIGIAYGRKLMDDLMIGVRFDYLQMRIAQYGKKSVATAEMGLQARVVPQVLLGFHVYNPFQVRLLEGETLPVVIRLGVQYEASDKVKVFGEIDKISELPEGFAFGIEYLFLDRLAARIGYSTQPQLVTFGVGYSLDRRYSIDVGTSVHSYLGLSSAGTLKFQK